MVVWGDPQSRDENIQTIYAEEGLGSTVSIPLVAQGKLIGSLNLGFEEPEPRFTQEHQAIARQVADQLAIAIQQSRLNEQVQRHSKELQQQVSDRTRELAVLHEVAALSSQPLDLETKLARSLAQVLLTVRSAGGSIHLLDEAEDETLGDGATECKRLCLAVQQGLPADLVAEIKSLDPGEGMVGWVVEHNEPLFVPDIAADPRIVTALPEELRAFIGLPLQTAGRTVGVFSIIRGKDQAQLSVEEISLLTSIADQLAIAVESVRLRKRDERAAVLEERERLARDLHDSVTQLLYSMNLFAKSGRNAYNLGDMQELNYCLNELGEIGPQALREMRLLLYELRPYALEQRGLVGALQHRLDAVEGRVGVMTQLLASEEIELPGWLEEELYHIATEALNNALKHARASSVTVSLGADAGRIWLEVGDNGIGFDPAALQDRGGLGIVGMRERAQRLGWSLQLFSAPGKGTKVRVELEGSRRIP
jgi:signal transduction histidine kinase